MKNDIVLFKDNYRITSYILLFIIALKEAFKIEKNYIILFSIFVIIIFPYLFSYSDSLAFSVAKYSVDEFEFGWNLIRIAHGKFFGLYAFGYGSSYWLLSTFVALPSIILNSEQGIVVSLRLLSLGFSMASFLIIAKIFQKRGYGFWSGSIFIIICFFSKVNIDLSTQIHPETIYSFFLVLAFYFLYEDSNQFGKFYYYSLIFFSIALSIKPLSTLFCISYVIYFIKNFRSINSKLILKSSLILGIPLFIQNIFLLKLELLKYYINKIIYQSQILRKGYLNISTSFGLEEFSINYINIFSLILILGLFIVLSIFIFYKKDRNFIYDLICFSIISVYTLFCLFYARTPGHYGITTIFFFPLLISTLYQQLRYKIIRTIFLITFILLNISNISNVYYVIKNPTGSNRSIQISQALIYIDNYIYKKYDKLNKVKYIGISHDLALNIDKNKPIEFTRLWSLNEITLSKCDLLIFWKDDSYYKKIFVNKLKNFENTFELYNKISFGMQINYKNKCYYFEKIVDDERFEIYQSNKIR